MSADTYNDQRPVVIAAVIVAALTAAGLWYFLVLRPAATSEVALETPTPLVSETPATTAVASEAPAAAAPQSEAYTKEQPVAASDIKPTAPTGPAETTIFRALILTAAGLLGLRQIQARRA